MGAKRQRLVDQGPSFYGTSPGPSFMYNPPPYGYVAQPPPFPVVRLRGLPFDCTETDVAEFFRGLDIVDVLFVHKNGKFTGEAFCVFGYPLQVDFALCRTQMEISACMQAMYMTQPTCSCSRGIIVSWRVGWH